jgi:flagellin
LAEGSLSEVSNMLRRMREIAVQSANGTINDANREGISVEFNLLAAEIDRVALSTTYNDQVLLTGFGNMVSQSAMTSTALDGFSGVKEVGISGAIPGTYRFSDVSDQDNQVTLSIVLENGTELKQSIDIGTTLDRDGDSNLVATGTTFVANFDRLGVQVTLIGPRVDMTSNTLKSSADLPAPPTAAGIAGTIIVGNQVVDIVDSDNLQEIADILDAKLQLLSPPGFARYDAHLNEVQIDTAGNSLVDGDNILELTAANSYVDGRLHEKEIVIQEGEGGVLQVGAKNEASHRIAVTIGDMRGSGAALNLTGLSIANVESSRAAMSRLDSAILAVARQRGELGAIQNRLQYTMDNLENSIENLAAAESGIRDADVAEEISNFTRSQIMTQAATAMIAQANALPQIALQLLQ